MGASCLTPSRAKLRTGGGCIGQKWNFFKSTVPIGAAKDAPMMNDEPFGLLAVTSPFAGFDEATTDANRLPCDLASDALACSNKTANAIAAAAQAA